MSCEIFDLFEFLLDLFMYVAIPVNLLFIIGCIWKKDFKTFRQWFLTCLAFGIPIAILYILIKILICY